jgi:hypothetical protein
MANGVRLIERIKDAPLQGRAVEPSGFFNLPHAEDVSAVVINPQGTLTKVRPHGLYRWLRRSSHPSVLHNPNSLIALDPMQIVSAAHEFLQDHG